MSDPFVTGLVLEAGGSSRLGRPEQLLPVGAGTLPGHTVSVARLRGFGHVPVAIGGAADEVGAAVDLDGVDVLVRGDKGVWRLLDRADVVEMPIAGPIPLDVDALHECDIVRVADRARR